MFKSLGSPVEVYFSYECVKQSKSTKKEDDNSTELTKVTSSFNRVSNLLLQQEKEMERLMEIGNRHSEHMESHLNQLW